jgi:hypothetical protein
MQDMTAQNNNTCHYGISLADRSPISSVHCVPYEWQARRQARVVGRDAIHGRLGPNESMMTAGSHTHALIPCTPNCSA